MLQQLRAVIPKFSFSKHKGQDGRLCIIGGSFEYTGAPYFAGQSCYRFGADLVTIVCDAQAALPIKSMSPELMVYGILDCTNKQISKDLDKWMKESLNRMHAIIVGPGLGRNENILNTSSAIIKQALTQHTGLVLDGDALFLLALPQHRALLSDAGHAKSGIDAMEFRRLWINFILKKDFNIIADGSGNEYVPPFDTSDLRRKITQNEQNESKEQSNVDYAKLRCDEVLSVNDFENVQHIRDTALLANSLGGLTILRKGALDIICDGSQFVLIGDPFSLRRCGGQGDIMAGICGLFLHWAMQYRKDNKNNDVSASLVAAYAGAYLTRSLAAEAFAKYKRSTLTTDMIGLAAEVMEKHFPVSNITSSL